MQRTHIGAHDWAARSALPNAIGADAHAGKIEDTLLFATLSTSTAVWLVVVLGLSLTIKREYLRTFVSLQTGTAYVQSYFLDGGGDDARRVLGFICNERQWQAIRDRVRQWVLRVYATWRALMPAWFTEDLQARIPDDFMPVQALHELNAQAPDGRRPTVQGMALFRRASHAASVASDSDTGVRRLSELPSAQDGQRRFVTKSASCFEGPAPTKPATYVESRRG
jgi:hypothetical protein